MEYEKSPRQSAEDCMLAEPVVAYGAGRGCVEPRMAVAADGVGGRFDRMMGNPVFREAMLNWLDKSAATDGWHSHEEVWDELERGLCGEAL